MLIDFIIIILKISFIFLIWFFFVTPWLSHIIMSLTERKPYKFILFKAFKDVFSKCKGIVVFKLESPKSIFMEEYYNYNYTCYIHAGLIIIEDKCFILIDPISYMMFLFWKKQYIKNHLQI